MHLEKKGIRVLGISESYQGRIRTTIAGIVMRRDLVIDGAAFTHATVGGNDATDAVLSLFSSLSRDDVNCIMLSGCVISWFNIIDGRAISDATGLPVIGVSYEASEGLEDDILHHFPDDAERLEAYRHLGVRSPYILRTGEEIYIRAWNCTFRNAEKICDLFTLQGKIPEPLRVARIMARAVFALEECQ